jgi:CheY-like chemotaxis protein
MPVIQVIAGLLAKDLEWVVEFAESGAQALSQMEFTLPDVLVTDMVMPGMNGLELVSALRREYPQVPVILITGQGSETLAVEALKQGAASYVAKNQLGAKLLETVEEVLALSRIKRSRDRLLECMAASQSVFKLDNDPALIARMVETIQQTASDLKLLDDTELRRLGVAATEALFNALFHGNLELPTLEVHQARAEALHGRTSPAVKQRANEPPYRDRRIAVRTHFTRKEIRVVIRDEGPGFKTKGLPQAHDPKAIDQKGGRGLVLMRSFMDEILFNDSGNEVTLVKMRPIDLTEVPANAQAAAAR